MSFQQTLENAWRLHQAGQIEQAEEYYRQVLNQDPKHADAWVYLGIALFDRREFVESSQAYREALTLSDRNPIAWNNLGNSLRMQGLVEEADQCFERALQQKPNYLSALKNRGTLWVWSGEVERGLSWYERGLKVASDDVELHRNLGVIHLLQQDYARGWPEYRWRWRMSGNVRPIVTAPIWQGQSLQGKTILLYPEQGLGDAIHFVRMAAVLKSLGARVLLQCSARLLSLFTSVSGVDQLLLDQAPLPAVDYHASLIDVVDVLWATTGEMEWGAEAFDDKASYLAVSQELVAYWKNWLHELKPGRRIGIVWQGNREHHADVYRSISLEQLRPLSELKDVELISLQLGDGAEQLGRCEWASEIVRLPEHFDSQDAFTDTAAIVQQLDAVVTTDTSIAHLAGAVGANVHVLLGKVPDWRWGTTGTRTPWYPAMRLHRQKTLGDWRDVVGEVAAVLSD
ncbi:MAG: tetratricopeptide repeat-containing glycosyltransferase family protein [Rubripirellula sp.]|jgi:Flp pilus assembly protein TadD|nr:tetratricopeptide repeat protein [Planctomycetaceae bacterium]MDF1840245.1 tetratricopeptide repeat-containing glycosyltransferase family protein [Rubripirellula sp.]